MTTGPRTEDRLYPHIFQIITDEAERARTDDGSLSRTRTCDRSINSRLLYQLSYQGPGRRAGRMRHIASQPRIAKRQFERARQDISLAAARAKHCLRAASFAIGGGASSSRRGLVAEWLRRGLQILAPRFDSGRGLHRDTRRRRAPPASTSPGGRPEFGPCLDAFRALPRFPRRRSSPSSSARCSPRTPSSRSRPRRRAVRRR